jgi:putative MFS transporter
MTSATDGQHDIVARLERLPLTPFHIRMRFAIGVATFFDLFDAIMIAFVLPALIGPWKLAPTQIGSLISAAYIGQFVGALFFGWLAGKIGRRRVILMTTLLYGLGSLLVATAWSPQSLFVLRVLQGFGLGGEVPVASAYLCEWIAASKRGRFVVFFELAAPLGILAAGALGAWIVPRFGWRWMFIIGALPALLVFPLRRRIPESPRYLLETGRRDEAERIVADIERQAGQMPVAAPAPSRPAPVARAIPGYLAGVVGLIWFACYFVNYGLTGWLPAIYNSVFHLDVGTSLRFGLVTSVAGLVGAVVCGLLIDRIGRRNWFMAAFAAAATALLVLAWLQPADAHIVAVLCSIAYIFISGCSAALYLYTPEIFPTDYRAFGVGAGSACARVASAVAPILVGMLLARTSMSEVFLMFGAMSVAGALLSLPLLETARKQLEAIVGAPRA